MKYHYIFLVNKDSTAEKAILELYSFLSDIYEMDDPQTNTIQIAGYSDLPHPPPLTHATLEAFSPVDDIDWEKQWESYAPAFHEGVAHIDLHPFGGPTLLLKPGAGFGDLSHPTTRLVLSLMAPRVKNQTLIDIGSGSGILSLAGLLLGASQSYGIDIDERAVVHSLANATLNHLEENAHFSTHLTSSQLPPGSLLILMNMITSEQIQAWGSLPLLHGRKATVITSGVLASQREAYMEEAGSRGWVQVEEREEEGWMGFVFTQKKG